MAFQNPQHVFQVKRSEIKKLDAINILKSLLRNMYCLCCIHDVIITMAVLDINNYKNINTCRMIYFIVQVNHVDLEHNYVDIPHDLCWYASQLLVYQNAT